MVPNILPAHWKPSLPMHHQGSIPKVPHRDKRVVSAIKDKKLERRTLIALTQREMDAFYPSPQLPVAAPASGKPLKLFPAQCQKAAVPPPTFSKLELPFPVHILHPPQRVLCGRVLDEPHSSPERCKPPLLVLHLLPAPERGAPPPYVATGEKVVSQWV